MTGRVIRFKSLVRLIGITGWKFQLLFQWPLFSRKLLNWLSMDQTLLTGLLSFRFRSLADSASPAVWWAISSSWDSLTAPKLRFSTPCKGTRSETGASCEKGSPTELMIAVWAGPSFHEGNGSWAPATVVANPSATVARLTSVSLEPRIIY